MITKAKRRPIEIEAIQFDGCNQDEIFKFTNNKAYRVYFDEVQNMLEIGLQIAGKTNIVCIGDYIIKETETGILRDCSAPDFWIDYEILEE